MADNEGAPERLTDLPAEDEAKLVQIIFRALEGGLTTEEIMHGFKLAEQLQQTDLG